MQPSPIGALAPNNPQQHPPLPGLRRRLPLTPEERFGKWVAIGVPLFFVAAIAGTIAIHTGYTVPWRQLLLPAGLFVGIQIGFYMCAFWAGKWARHQNQYWPMSLLIGFYLWAAGLIAMHYGSSWGILPPYGGWRNFSICMALLTVFGWLIAVRLSPKIAGRGTKQNR